MFKIILLIFVITFSTNIFADDNDKPWLKVTMCNNVENLSYYLYSHVKRLGVDGVRRDFEKFYNRLENINTDKGFEYNGFYFQELKRRMDQILTEYHLYDVYRIDPQTFNRINFKDMAEKHYQSCMDEDRSE